MGLPVALVQLAAAQGGCVRRSQLVDHGVSARSIDRMIAAGSIGNAMADVYRIIGSRGWADDVRAAVLALPGAVASHQAAAAILGFPRLRPAATVMVHTRTTHEFPGVVVHRVHDVLPDHVTVIEGLRCTTTPRTIVDLSAVLHPKHLSAIIQDLVLTGDVRTTAIAQALEDVARRGKPGVRSLRATLEELGSDPRPMTVLERRGSELLGRCGLSGGVRQHPIPWNESKRFDVAWPELGVAVEWDSRRWHGALDRMANDRERDRTAAINGWVVLRFTWDDVTRRPDRVAADVRAVLESRPALGR